MHSIRPRLFSKPCAVFKKRTGKLFVFKSFPVDINGSFYQGLKVDFTTGVDVVHIVIIGAAGKDIAIPANVGTLFETVADKHVRPAEFKDQVWRVVVFHEEVGFQTQVFIVTLGPPRQARRQRNARLAHRKMYGRIESFQGFVVCHAEASHQLFGYSAFHANTTLTRYYSDHC